MLAKLKPKSEFSKNVLTLMTGTTIAQAIAISPILTRIYSQEYFICGDNDNHQMDRWIV